MSSGLVRITGIAFGWIAPTTSFALIVRKPKSVCSPATGFALVPRTPVQDVHRPAKNASGRFCANANQVGVFFGFVSAYSQKLVHGTRQRLEGPSQGRQWGLLLLRMFVTGAPN